MNLKQLNKMSHQTTASYSSQFIKNYTEDTPTGDKNILSLIDSDNKPLVFTHGSDDKLYVTRQKDGDSGWVQLDLMKYLEADSILTAFDVYQDPDSKLIRICIGIKNNDDKNELYITALLDYELFVERFSTETFWTKLTANEDEVIDHILVDKDGAFITTHKKGQNALFYRIDENNKSKEYQFSEDTEEIKEIKLGRWNGLSGLFLLYTLGSEQTISFRGFPDNPKYPDQFFSTRFAHEGKIDSIAITKNSSTNNHDLYIAGEKGLYCYKYEEDRIEILLPVNDFSFKNLQISQDQGFISCWFLDSSNRKTLYYMYNNPSEDRWSVPVPLKNNVEQYTSIRSKDIRNHLFYTDNRKKLFHFFEDEISSLWYDNFVPLQGTETFKESVGYITEVKFDDASVIEDTSDAFVQLTSPVNIYVSVDEALYQIGPDSPITIPYNGQGSIFISHTLNSGFVDAVLCLTAPFLKSSLAIDMAKSIYDKIEKLANNNFDDIKDITKSDGTPLLPDEYKNNEDTLKELAKALKYLVDFRNDCRGNDICGTNVKSLTSNLKDVMYQETMILKITGGLLGATIGGIAGVNAFLGAALLVPKDPISEGFLFVGALISGIIGAIIGGAIGWTLITTITRTPIDEGTEPDKPPESCPGLIFSRVGCNGSMTFSNDMCANASSKLNVNHMFSSIDMILTFVGITPSDIPEWPTDNDDCVYNGYLY